MFTGKRTAALEARIRELEVMVSALQNALHTALKQNAPAELAARVAAIETAVDTLASSHRVQFGKLWRKLGHEIASEEPAGGPALAENSELDAWLQAQRMYGGN